MLHTTSHSLQRLQFLAPIIQNISRKNIVKISTGFQLKFNSKISPSNHFNPETKENLLRTQPIFNQQKSFKSRKVSKKKSGRPSKTEEDDDNLDDSDDEDEDDSDDESEYSRLFFKEDESLPNNYREIISQQSSMRLDSILSAGLNTSRSKVDEYFLGSQLKVNGGKVLKKAVQLSEGDYVDVIIEVKDNEIRLKRIRIVKVLPEKTASGKKKIVLRCWRQNVSLPRV